MNPETSSLSQRLVQALKNAGYTNNRATHGASVKEFAELIDVPKQTAGRYLDGTTELKPDKIKKVAEWLNVSTEWLTYGIGSPKTKTVTVPLIDWDDIKNLPKFTSDKTITVNTEYPLSDNSFALMMQVDLGIPMLPVKSKIIFDPEIKPKTGSMVLTQDEAGGYNISLAIIDVSGKMSTTLVQDYLNRTHKTTNDKIIATVTYIDYSASH